MSELGTVIGDDKSRLEVDDEAQIGTFGNLSYFEMPSETIYVDPVSIRVDKVFPVTGSCFIVGHATHGVIGSGVVGFVGSYNRIAESKIYEDFSEEFTSTTYKDATFTTANWTTTGSLMFVSGSVAQSLGLGSDILRSDTKIDRVKITVAGSNWINVVGSVTTDGTNWFGISYDVWNQLSSGSTGSVIKWKLVDSNQKARIDKLDLTYKQNDI